MPRLYQEATGGILPRPFTKLLGWRTGRCNHAIGPASLVGQLTRISPLSIWAEMTIISDHPGSQKEPVFFR
jgi:hypothetical protein